MATARISRTETGQRTGAKALDFLCSEGFREHETADDLPKDIDVLMVVTSIGIAARDVVADGMPVQKEVIVTVTCSESWEDAALSAVDRTEASVENLYGAVVQDQWLALESPGEPQFKTNGKIGFEIEA